jgi:hypothetical protein
MYFHLSKIKGLKGNQKLRRKDHRKIISKFKIKVQILMDKNK